MFPIGTKWGSWQRTPRHRLILVLGAVATGLFLSSVIRFTEKAALQANRIPLIAGVQIKTSTFNDKLPKFTNTGKMVYGSQFISKNNFVKNFMTTEDILKKDQLALPLCDNVPPYLGPVHVNMKDLELEWVERKYPQVHWGGRYFPPKCKARRKVAIIVPYRDRQQHLTIFLNHMHAFLIKQETEYRIFIIEQDGTQLFNRAKLFNVGFVESQRLEPGSWNCFILHDIDLLPVDTRNMYSCAKQPKHMSAAVNKFNEFFAYDKSFGGVSAVTTDQFMKVNGFSNVYWGWGAEDDDMFRRLMKMNYHVASYKASIARYNMIDHNLAARNPQRFELYEKTSEMLQNDGLSNIEYEIKQVVEYHLYTHVLVNIGEPK